MQFQADVAGVGVERPSDIESTGRGAAMLAGIGVGLSDVSAAAAMVKIAARFEPKMPAPEREAHLAKWKAAVARARS